MKLYLLESSRYHPYDLEFFPVGVVTSLAVAKHWVRQEKLLPMEVRRFQKFELDEIPPTQQEAHISQLWAPKRNHATALLPA